MRVFLLVSVLVLAGCSGVTPLAELREQAFLTGNWNAVERREQMIARRDAHRGIQCPPGAISYCEKRIGQKRCACVSKDELETALSWR